MQKHLLQAEHNQNLHDCINTQFNGQFCDWQIVILFYVALHYLKALAAHRKINIGSTHEEIESCVNPYRNDAIMRISKSAWNCYRNLKKYSTTARYEGFIDYQLFSVLMKDNHTSCLSEVGLFKGYVSKFIKL